MGYSNELYYANKVLKNAYFCTLMRRISEIERDRIYCRHGIRHALDVCRIAYILFCEQGGAAEPAAYKDRIYCIGLLHDTGRCAQYLHGENHAAAGARIAGEILEEIGYPEALREEAVRIIAMHRGRVPAEELRTGPAVGFCTKDTTKDVLADCILRADQLSRNCGFCPASDTCKWSEDEKNTGLFA